MARRAPIDTSPRMVYTKGACGAKGDDMALDGISERMARVRETVEWAAHNAGAINAVAEIGPVPNGETYCPGTITVRLDPDGRGGHRVLDDAVERVMLLLHAWFGEHVHVHALPTPTMGAFIVAVVEWPHYRVPDALPL